MITADGKRPDGCTQIAFENGKKIVWDATCADTFASSNIAAASQVARSVAENAALRKTNKYSQLPGSEYHFVPVAVETSGSIGAAARDLI